MCDMIKERIGVMDRRPMGEPPPPTISISDEVAAHARKQVQDSLVAR